jgi:hypothetical protein
MLFARFTLQQMQACWHIMLTAHAVPLHAARTAALLTHAFRSTRAILQLLVTSSVLSAQHGLHQLVNGLLRMCLWLTAACLQVCPTAPQG